jgi:2-polyprenyl-3-methyl-5-hydroxy-6-metoxy-1,4-benzoquinol methylase
MMKALRDPEGAELNHLIKACELTGKRVLEIGCGDGKFIRQYARMPSRLVGIDPGLADLSTAKNMKSAFPDPAHFIVQEVYNWKVHAHHSTTIALLVLLSQQKKV